MSQSFAPIIVVLSLGLAGCGEGTLDPSTAGDDLGGNPGSQPGDPADDPFQPLPVSDPLAPVIEPDDVLPQGELPEPQVARPDYIDSSGFFVVDGRVYDTLGHDFVGRGINNAHIWYDTDNRYLAMQALDDIAAYGFNSVRIVWETEQNVPTSDPRLLDAIIAEVLNHGMVPMVELHDATGDETNEGLLAMAEYYTREDVLPILQKWEQFLIVNIANEWSGEDFFNAYSQAIEHLRDNGVNHLLVIDGNGFGQNASSLLENGQALLDFDPQHNLLFSVHMYGTYAGAGGPAQITSVLDDAAELGLPFIVGEFGWQVGNQNRRPIDFRHIMAECERHRFGYYPWSWKGNSANVAYLDMAVEWTGQTLTQWGSDLIMDENGIAATSQPASFFAAAE